MMRFYAIYGGHGNQCLEVLAGELLQKLLLVEPIFKSFATVDEDDRDFVSELALELIIGFNVDLSPAETTPALQFRELLFDYLAEVTPFAGIYDYLAQK
ncbi:MAG TPA: hypothetical protein VFA90_14925 [Terriglobales bacterium]|nr:hypothetical protein [Terriglobales bacterium]